MRRQSRWAVAALAIGLVAAVSPLSARTHHQRTPRASRTVPATPPPVPTAGAAVEVVAAPAGGTAAGKGGPPVARGPHDAAAILGRSVHSATGEDMGRLVDVVVDTDGRPRAAIIDFGGFLGVGSRKIAVDWAALRFAPNDPKGEVITVELTRDQVKAAPEFKEGNPIMALGASGAPSPPQAAPRPQAQEK
jgi:hypothetical protein